MEDPKPWYESKTVWLNFVAAFLAALEGTTGALQPILGEHAMAVIATLLPPLNIALRTVTNQPLSVRK